MESNILSWRGALASLALEFCTQGPRGTQRKKGMDGRLDARMEEGQNGFAAIEPEIEEEALAGIVQGLADAEAGRVTPLEEFEAEFRAWNGLVR